MALILKLNSEGKPAYVKLVPKETDMKIVSIEPKEPEERPSPESSIEDCGKSWSEVQLDPSTKVEKLKALMTAWNTKE